MADAADRRTAHPLLELLGFPCEERRELRIVEAVTHFPQVGVRSSLRELVPRAGQLAVIAAVDAVADQRSQLLRDRVGEFDGEVGDAAARIELPRRGDGSGRTSGDAGLAAAAMTAASAVGGQRQIGV